MSDSGIDLLLNARVGVDLPRRSGDVFRGAYIASECGRYYLNKNTMQWDDGAKDHGCWFRDRCEAESFLTLWMTRRALFVDRINGRFHGRVYPLVRHFFWRII